jgi:hypothetical protein
MGSYERQDMAKTVIELADRLGLRAKINVGVAKVESNSKGEVEKVVLK